MTDAEKLAQYECIVEIVDDYLALEIHERSKQSSWEEIQAIRANAYKAVVHALIGKEALHKILINRATVDQEPADAAQNQPG